MSNANAQVGIGTPSPHASAELDLTATDKGFLPPRMNTAQRNVINSGAPAEGLVIYNTDIDCLQFWNGSGWFDACDGNINGIIPTNTTCETATISATPCSAVPGATISASQPHDEGTLYDWTDATSYMGGTTANALVEIGGQCWFGRNTNTPSPYTGTNDFDGFYNNAASEPAVGEGRLYQWQAAMNGSTTERAQGVCPTGWHVPSDCEWMYLENTLGMSTPDQQNTSWRGTQGRKLSTLVSAPATNSSGFTALLAGRRLTDDNFLNRGNAGYWWDSSETSTANARWRVLSSSRSGVDRLSVSKAYSLSVRCLKD